MTPTITREQLSSLIASGNSPLLFEALPAQYYDDWHLPGARHFPHDQARALAPQVVPYKAAEIVVYCASKTCQNSHIAASMLRQIGHANVAVYAGGKEDWAEGGLAREASRASATVAA